jgi:hypothetical protein
MRSEVIEKGVSKKQSMISNLIMRFGVTEVY